MTPDDSSEREDRKQAFATLLEPVLGVAYRVAYNLTRHDADAQELVQESAVLAFNGFESFEPGSNFKAWFMKIVKNRFLMNMRKYQPQTVSFAELEDTYLYNHADAAELFTVSEDPAAELLRDVTAKQLSDALNQLPDAYQVVSAFYFVDELSYQEIAEVLEVPIGTVRSRLHRGRKMLQQLLWPLAEESAIIKQSQVARGTSS